MPHPKIIYINPVMVAHRLVMAGIETRYRVRLTGIRFRFKYDPRTSPAIDSWLRECCDKTHPKMPLTVELVVPQGKLRHGYTTKTSRAVPIPIPRSPESSTFHVKPKRLLDVSDVAEWLGVSKGWMRDHALGRRQPRLLAIKLGPAKGKGLWKFREEDVHQFIQDQRRR
jgi:hypothetical protein